MARADRWTFNKRIRSIYTDFDRNLTIDPATNQLKVLVNENDVRSRLYNLVMIRPMELPYSRAGSRLQNMLFELINQDEEQDIKDELLNVIRAFEPSVSNVFVEVDLNPPEANQVRVRLTFDITNVIDRVVIDTVIRRVR